MRSHARPPQTLVIGGSPVRSVGPVRVYACGMTPYETAHVGHAATFVWVDTALRVLRELGHRAELCRNVTDVDDALTAAAARSDTPYDELATLQTFDFDRLMTALHVARPAHEPRAHAFVAEVVALAAGLVESGDAYVVDGSVFFRGRSVVESSGLDAESASEEIRAAGDLTDDGREDPFDTPVWRSTSDPSAPGWPSPWGRGRPGWHAECAAMSISTFGPAIDLHAGGADLRFPHHAYETALAEAFTGVRPFSRAWMHVGEVRIRGAKMSKSAGNCLQVADVLQAHAAEAFRLALLRRRVGDPWEYSDEAVSSAGQLLAELRAAAGAAGGASAVDAVRAALAEELDVPAALDVAIDSGGLAASVLLRVLGMEPEDD